MNKGISGIFKTIEDTVGLRLAILLFAVLIYLAVVVGFDYISNIHSLVYSTIDAKGYRSAMRWILGNPDEKSSLLITIRPYLYPLLLALLKNVHSIYGIVIFQFCFWLLSLNIVFSSLKMLEVKAKWMILGVSLFIVNITAIIVTLHALTESVTILLLALYVYLVIKNYLHKKLNLWGLIVLVTVLLTLIKPLFQYLMYFSLIFAAVDLFLKKKTPSFLFYSLLLASAILFSAQLKLMHSQVNEIKVSRIGKITFKDFYFKYTYSRINPGLKDEELRCKMEEISNSEMISFLKDHPVEAIQSFFHNIFYKNLGSHSTLSRIPTKHDFLVNWSGITNRILFIVHVFFLLFILKMIYRFYKDNDKELLITTLALCCPLYLIFFTSGITLWQGDRVIVTALPVWIVLYALTIKKIRDSPTQTEISGER